MPSYIRNTTDSIKQIEGIKGINENAILVTMDVSSLYTNISHDEGIEAIDRQLLLQRLYRLPYPGQLQITSRSNSQEEQLPGQWKSLPANRWNSNGQ